MPRIVSGLNAARLIDIAFIDGIDSVTGGEGPWIKGLKLVHPGVMILGTNAVSTDAVGTAVMGYDPRAGRDTPPFRKCDNMLTLAEAKGIGSADLTRIEVCSVSVSDAL